MKFKIIKTALPLLLVVFFAVIFGFNKKPANQNTEIKLSFKNVVNGQPLVLNDFTYINPFGESYTIKKFQYYISNIQLNAENNSVKEPDSYHLIDASKPGSLSFSIQVKKQEYNSITFLLGVDSIRNVSGAQSGALDPLNDMFWTWNNGYVMAKFEGNSASSKLYNNMFEYHIGGFTGKNNVLKTITLNLPKTSAEKINEIIIEADANSWWKGTNDVKISETAGITTPGSLAKMVSDNYAKMFSVAGTIK